MKYFLTGATGFVGGEVARQLLAAGHGVVALVRDPARAEGLRQRGAALYQGDILNKDSMREGMLGVDGVFHIAGWYQLGSRNPQLGKRINIDGTRNVLELMLELGIPKGVYTSTLACFSDTQGRVTDETTRFSGPWLSEYDRTKWVAHFEVADPLISRGLPLVVVLPGVIYGPGDSSLMHSTLTQYLTQRLPIVPQRTAFCFAHVEDSAYGHILAMEKGVPGESYIIAGSCRTVVEVLELCERLTGIPAPRLRLPPWVMRVLAGVMALPAALGVPLPPEFHPESLRVLGGATYIGTSERARRELGFEARSLEQGLPETLAHEMRALGIAPPEAG